jgi:hypothetical protein
VRRVPQVNQKEEVRLRAPPPEPAPEPAGPSAEECAPRSACQKRSHCGIKIKLACWPSARAPTAGRPAPEVCACLTRGARARSFFDPELGTRSLRKLERRKKTGFDFVQEGRFQKLAETQRLKVRPCHSAPNEPRM